MPGIRKVTSKEVLRLLEEGKRISEIATLKHTTTKNIWAHKQRLIKKGLYKSKDTGLQWTLDLDQATDFLIDRLEKAKKAIELEKSLQETQRREKALMIELLSLKKQMAIRDEQQKRYRIALDQSEINEPVIS